METILAQGAEATLLRKDNLVHKSRVAKSYRISEIDDSLRLSRTRKETKALLKAKELGVSVPDVHPSPNKYTIVLDYIDGKRLRDVAISLDQNILNYFTEVGTYLATLHENGLIHGDLTTSNILIAQKLYLIDFGLSFFSGKVEDMAVDIHVLEEALESTHYQYAEKYFEAFLDGYKQNPQYAQVIERLEIVKLRGKNK